VSAFVVVHGAWYGRANRAQLDAARQTGDAWNVPSIPGEVFGAAPKIAIASPRRTNLADEP